MKELIDGFVSWSTSWLISFGPIAGVLLIVLESIIPALPLAVFIALNIKSYGMLLGFLISWLSTVLGCMLSFYMFRKLFQKKLYNYIKRKDSEKLDKFMNMITNISFPNLVVIVALPFTPASWINAAAGLSKINSKKFLTAIFIGKPAMVYFWGYIGKSFLESLTDISTMIKIALLLIGAFLISKFVEKKFNLR